MMLETLVVGALQVNCYVLGAPGSGQAIVIDPGDNPAGILKVLRDRELKLVQIVATHGHFDHVLAARPLQEATGAPFYINRADLPALAAMRRTAISWLGIDPGEAPAVDGDLFADHSLSLDDIVLEIRATPGHSPGGVSLVDHTGKRIFTGDALFAGSIGRTDMPGGDAKVLLTSIQEQILSLPDEYVVLPGHGPATTVGQERRSNPFLDPAAFDFWL
jgi:hydroxyacylglutathione hydrolase